MGHYAMASGGGFLMGFVDAGNELVSRMMAGLDAMGDIIMAESLEQCPIETGTLRRSARVGRLDPGGQIRGRGNKYIGASGFSGDGHVILGYGFGDEINPITRRPASEYALPVHEIIEAYHKPPTKAKFLEDPVFEHAEMMEPLLASYMRLDVATPDVAAFIEGNPELFDEGAGAGNAALDAGDHPKGTPHE